MKKRVFILLILIPMLFSCSRKTGEKSKEAIELSPKEFEAIVGAVIKEKPETNPMLLKKGLQQLVAQWTLADGTKEELSAFVLENFVSSTEGKQLMFNKFSKYFEALRGGFNEISAELLRPTQLTGEEVLPIDYIFGSYSASSHYIDDFYKNKIAFICVLNFPFYTLEEKNALGEKWTRLEWAYSRLGDVFLARVPAEVLQRITEVETAGDNYISEYNIKMGSVLSEKGERLFPRDMSLLTHWNLRDEIKSNYAALPHNLEKQKIIYQIMLHIVNQSIPSLVINDSTYEWNPIHNKVFKAGKEVSFERELDKRYEMILNTYHANKDLDKYSFAYPTAIKRAFEQSMQMSDSEVEKMFIEFISSEKVKKIGKLIAERLGRPLEPFDIWYDGFKSRSSLNQDQLSQQTQKAYLTAQAFSDAIPVNLQKFGFPKDFSAEMGSAIIAEPARGSGHAWGAESKKGLSLLRTRIPQSGMDYKGFNIAIHELGHNVEQTISMRHVDHYFLSGVPNTAFTEALAFIFQKRDLELLGKSQNDPNLAQLTEYDIIWGTYEIMGVALLDLYVWRWMYENPKADPAALREATVRLAKEIWNQYYYPILGAKDSPILGIYSHMINSPIYLANYPMGHIIEFQLEQFFKTHTWTQEVPRIWAIGNLTPNEWMRKAVGQPISIAPMLN